MNMIIPAKRFNRSLMQVVIEVAIIFSFSTGVTMYRGKMTMDDVRLTSDRLQTRSSICRNSSVITLIIAFRHLTTLSRRDYPDL